MENDGRMHGDDFSRVAREEDGITKEKIKIRGRVLCVYGAGWKY